MLEKSFIIAFIVFGIHWIMYTPGMILHFVADWSARLKINSWLEKPIFACPICMVPYYGTLIYFIFLGTSVREWVIVLFCGMGINSVIVFLRPK